MSAKRIRRRPIAQHRSAVASIVNRMMPSVLKHLEADAVATPRWGNLGDAEEQMERAATMLALAVRERLVPTQTVELLFDLSAGYGLKVEWTQDRAGASLKIKAEGYPMHDLLHVPVSLVSNLAQALEFVLEYESKWTPDSSPGMQMICQGRTEGMPRVCWMPSGTGTTLIVAGKHPWPSEGRIETRFVLQRSQIPGFAKAIAKANRLAQAYLQAMGKADRTAAG